MNDLRQRLIAAFQAEHREYLDGIRAALAKLERAPAAAAELDEVFRLAHSLKAAARVCDFAAVEQVGQRLEAFFTQLRRGTLALGPAAFAAARQALDAVAAWAAAIAEDREPPAPAAALAALDRVLDKPQAAPPVADELTARLLAAFQIEHKEHLEGIRAFLTAFAAGEDLAQLDEAFRRAHSLKGAARIAGMATAEALAHRLETLFAAVRDGDLRLAPAAVRAIQQALDAIEDEAAAAGSGRPAPEPAPMLAALEHALNGPAAAAPPRRAPAAAAAPPAAETVRVSAEHLDRMLGSAGQLLSEGLRQDLIARELAGLSRQIDELAQAWKSVRGSAAPALRRLAEAPELAAVARYLHLAEQRVGVLAKRARALRRLQQRSAWDLQHQVGRLQQDARKVRMVSAESVLQGFRKMLRDLARDEGKLVEFEVAGFELHADRLVLQALKDPLMHALCNAVSHGIEPAAERLRRGKEEAGRISLRLETAGNRLRVEIDDDGRGIDAPAVIDAAVRHGLLSATEAAALSAAEQARLIFRPGLSTARAVTDRAGRGMGLSVVHEAVVRLQGEVDLVAKDGPGTRLVLSVPLSVATQRLLLVSCRGQTYGLPVHAIERLLRVKPQEIERVEGRPMVLLNGRPVPVRDLGELLGMGGATGGGADVPLLVLRAGAGRLALVVDAFLAERDSLVKGLDAPAARVAVLAGGLLLEDGAVALVLNPAALLRADRPHDRAALPPAVIAAAAPPPTRTVLVVDDSLTTRTLEKSILEAHGYTVRVAVDGLEALERLRGEAVDLVITDVQMPRLDGFQLLAEMKKDPRLARVPVIVVTSLARREDQERGLALGADAYVVKRKFDHEELLETIRQIL